MCDENKLLTFTFFLVEDEDELRAILFHLNLNILQLNCPPKNKISLLSTNSYQFGTSYLEFVFFFIKAQQFQVDHFSPALFL